jgi:hypothetical protein
VNLNITCATLSSTSSTGLPLAPTAARPMPKKIEKITSCRMSPRAIASTTEVGISDTSMSQPLCVGIACTALSVSVDIDGAVTPTPG